jgi:hypothetical protein
VRSLAEWLTAVGFASKGAELHSYHTGEVGGVKLCHTTLLAPGCSVYVLHDGCVYQLTPGSREGERMIETFVLMP